MQDCAGFSSKAPWPSFQPPFLQHFAAGGRSCAATRLWRRTLWGDVTRVWRTKVAPEGCILLHEPSGQYFLNFGTSPLGYCNMLWPLEALSRSARGGKKHTLWSLKEISRRGELVWAPVVRMEDWWVVTMLFRLHISMCESSGLMLLQTGKAEPLLQAAARRGLWHVEESLLRRLLKASADGE